jgi:hypothetical protein
MHKEYSYDSNEEGSFDVTDPNGDTILTDIEEEDVVINLVEHLNEPRGGYYPTEKDEGGEYDVLDREDICMITLHSEAVVESLLSHLNRDD